MKTNRTLRSLDLSKNKFKGTERRRWRYNGTRWERDPSTRKNPRKELVLDTMCDATSFQSIVESNHVCQLFLANKNNGVRETHEKEMRNINALENEGAKIRYKVVLAMFKLNTDLYNPVSKELSLFSLFIRDVDLTLILSCCSVVLMTYHSS